MVTTSVFASGLDHPESLAWDPRGWVIAGGEAGQLYRVDASTGNVETIAETGGFVLGIALDARGRIYWCDLKLAQVRRFDPVSEIVDTFTRGAEDQPFAVPNFPVFDAEGRLYVSDSGRWGANDGAVFVVLPDGRATVASSEPSAYSNGLAIDRSGEFLYVVESSLPGVSRLPIQADGRLGSKELVVELPRTVPDGLAFTADGRLLISCYRPDAVYIWDGRSIEPLVEDWTGLSLSAPTNVAFVGDGLDRLVTANLASSHLAELAAGLTGAPLHRPVMPS